VTRGLADPSSVCELPPEPESNCEPVDAFIPFCPVVFKCVVPAFDVWRPGPFLSSLDLQLSDGHGCFPVMYPVNMRWIIDDGLHSLHLHFQHMRVCTRLLFVLLGKDGTGVWLSGFEHAVKITTGDYARQVRTDGNLAYIAPEQTGRMDADIDYRTDLYSLGAMFYEMLTGRTPFETEDSLELIHSHLARIPECPSDVDHRILRPLSDIVMRLLMKKADWIVSIGEAIACIKDPVVIKKILVHPQEKSLIRAARLLPDSRASPQSGLFG